MKFNVQDLRPRESYLEIIDYLGTLVMFAKVQVGLDKTHKSLLSIVYDLILIKFGYSVGNKIINCLKQDKILHDLPSILYQCWRFILSCNRFNLIDSLLAENPHDTAKNIKFLDSLKSPKEAINTKIYYFDSSVYFIVAIQRIIVKNNAVGKIDKWNLWGDTENDYKHIKSYKSYAKKKSNKLEKQRHMIVVRNKQEVRREHLRFHKQQKEEELKQKKFNKKPLWEKQTIKSWRKFAHGVHIVFWGY